MGFANRMGLLKVPNVLQHKWLLFRFVFVAHDIPGVCGGGAEGFFFYVGHELAAFDLPQWYLDRFLFFYFLVFILPPSSPPPPARVLGMQVVGCSHHSRS